MPVGYYRRAGFILRSATMGSILATQLAGRTPTAIF